MCICARLMQDFSASGDNYGSGNTGYGSSDNTGSGGYSSGRTGGGLGEYFVQKLPGSG
jgi:hypothetical protein